MALVAVVFVVAIPAMVFVVAVVLWLPYVKAQPGGREPGSFAAKARRRAKSRVVLFFAF